MLFPNFEEDYIEMDVFTAFATDEEKEVNGVWNEIGDGAELLIARSGNRAHSRKLSQLFDRHARALDQKNEASEKLSEQIIIDATAEHVLLGWKKIKFKGVELPYSIENAKKLLAVKDFRALVSKLAGDIERYRVQQEAELGNVSQPA